MEANKSQWIFVYFSKIYEDYTWACMPSARWADQACASISFDSRENHMS